MNSLSIEQIVVTSRHPPALLLHILAAKISPQIKHAFTFQLKPFKCQCTAWLSQEYNNTVQ